MKIRFLFPLLLLLLTGLVNTAVIARDRAEVDAILKMSQPPEGVVFEILAGEDGLEWAIPRVQEYAERLHQRFPELAIAVVSHGREQFALQSAYQDEYKAVHKQVKSLVKDQVQVHVCGTYAEWKGVTPEEFPAYVNVAAEGPAQIRAYEDLGYIRVALSPPDDK